MISILTKRVAAIVASVAIVAATPLVAFAGYAPDRPTLTWNGPNTVGADHVVFGSDYPFPAAPDPLDDIVAELPSDLQDRISRRNVEDLYGALPWTGPHALSATGGHG